MFRVEVLCNSDEEGREEPEFEHYINGTPVHDLCPKALDIGGAYDSADDGVEPEEPEEPHRKEGRLKAYYGSRSLCKRFAIQCDNPVLSKLLEKYDYVLRDRDGVCYETRKPWHLIVQIDIDLIDPDYVGVTKLEDLTLTLIHLLTAIGSARSGLAKELLLRKNEIMEGFSRVSGTSKETYDEEEDWGDGYSFTLKAGVFRLIIIYTAADGRTRWFFCLNCVRTAKSTARTDSPGCFYLLCAETGGMNKRLPEKVP